MAVPPDVTKKPQFNFGINIQKPIGFTKAYPYLVRYFHWRKFHCWDLDFFL